MYLSIVIPCYNEGKEIKGSILTLLKFMEKYTFDYEIIPVNDGSSDNTKEIIKGLSKENNKIKCVSYKPNRGKGYAVKKGIEASSGEYILFMDADLSTDLSGIDTFLKKIVDYDMVIGSRRHPDSVIPKPQGAVRKFIGNSCVVITKALTKIQFNDTQCGFKGFNKSLAQVLVKKQKIFGWAFDVEYLYIATVKGYKIADIPIKWQNDEDSKVSPLKSSLTFFGELLKIVKNKKYYK